MYYFRFLFVLSTFFQSNVVQANTARSLQGASTSLSDAAELAKLTPHEFKLRAEELVTEYTYDLKENFKFYRVAPISHDLATRNDSIEAYDELEVVRDLREVIEECEAAIVFTTGGEVRPSPLSLAAHRNHLAYFSQGAAAIPPRCLLHLLCKSDGGSSEQAERSRDFVEQMNRAVTDPSQWTGIGGHPVRPNLMCHARVSPFYYKFVGLYLLLSEIQLTLLETPTLVDRLGSAAVPLISSIVGPDSGQKRQAARSPAIVYLDTDIFGVNFNNNIIEDVARLVQRHSTVTNEMDAIGVADPDPSLIDVDPSRGAAADHRSEALVPDYRLVVGTDVLVDQQPPYFALGNPDLYIPINTGLLFLLPAPQPQPQSAPPVPIASSRAQRAQPTELLSLLLRTLLIPFDTEESAGGGPSKFKKSLARYWDTDQGAFCFALTELFGDIDPVLLSAAKKCRRFGPQALQSTVNPDQKGPGEIVDPVYFAGDDQIFVVETATNLAVSLNERKAQLLVDNSNDLNNSNHSIFYGEDRTEDDLMWRFQFGRDPMLHLNPGRPDAKRAVLAILCPNQAALLGIEPPLSSDAPDESQPGSPETLRMETQKTCGEHELAIRDLANEDDLNNRERLMQFCCSLI